MIRVLLYLGVLVLTVWALLDIAQTPARQVEGLPRLGWGLVVLAPFFGPLAWFLLGRTSDDTRARSRRPAASGPIGPDDDPEFLRRLGRGRPDGQP